MTKLLLLLHQLSMIFRSSAASGVRATQGRDVGKNSSAAVNI
jgi:hypothetical protein